MFIDFTTTCAIYICGFCHTRTTDSGELYSERETRSLIETYCEHCSARHLAEYDNEDASWYVQIKY